MRLSYIPFYPIRGQQFTVFGNLSPWGSYTNYATPSSVYVSKDSGSLTECTNALVTMGSNAAVTLTADEMDADVVLVEFRGGSYKGVTVLYTQKSELASAPSINSSIAEKITAIFQYLFGKREVTASSMKVYKDDGTTELCSTTLSDDGTTVTKGKAV
jgi:hypothetical protein